MFLLGNNISEKKNIIIALNAVFGLSNTNNLKLISKLGYSKHSKISLNFRNLNLQNLDLIILKLIEINFKFKVFTNLKHFIQVSLKNLILTKSYKAVRHSQSLPVRGQRTHTNAKTQKRKLKNKKILKKK